jgi:hypothetical protein
MEFTFKRDGRDFDEVVSDFAKLQGQAAQEAIKDVAAYMIAKGRANIAAAGFAGGLENTLNVSTSFSSNRDVARVSHGVPYAMVFEHGATIEGKPLLWLPLPGTPKTIGARKMTAKLYEQEIGPLFYVKGGKYPMLYGYGGGAPAESALKAQPSRSKRLTNADLRSRTGEKIPLFIGLSSVTISKKLDILGIARQAAEMIPDFYEKHLGGR